LWRQGTFFYVRILIKSLGVKRPWALWAAFWQRPVRRKALPPDIRKSKAPSDDSAAFYDSERASQHS